jgi:hypothetical protein
VGVGLKGQLWSRRTQSLSPALLFVDGANARDPEFVNGDPETVVKFPLVGSYHLAVTGPVNFDMLTVIVPNDDGSG